MMSQLHLISFSDVLLSKEELRILGNLYCDLPLHWYEVLVPSSEPLENAIASKPKYFVGIQCFQLHVVSKRFPAPEMIFLDKTNG